MAELFIELFSEEIPAKLQIDARKKIKEMIEERDKTSKKLMCAQHFRFREISKMIKNEAENIGQIYHARSWMLRRNALPNRIGFLMNEHSGGGPCIDIGVHVLDLTLWFMGNPEPISVTGVSRTELAKEPGAFSKWGEYDSKIMDVEDFASAFAKRVPTAKTKSHVKKKSRRGSLLFPVDLP